MINGYRLGWAIINLNLFIYWFWFIEIPYDDWTFGLINVGFMLLFGRLFIKNLDETFSSQIKTESGEE